MQDRNVLAFKLKLGKLILRKIIKIVATRCHILKLKCIKVDFGWGFAPDPVEGAYSTPPDPLAGFKGPSKGREEGSGEGTEGYGKGIPNFQFSLLATLLSAFIFRNKACSLCPPITASASSEDINLSWHILYRIELCQISTPFL